MKIYKCMKKYFRGIILMLLVFNYSYSNTLVLPENDWKQKELKGKVKTMTNTEYEYGYSGKDKTVKKIVTSFNEKGYITKEEHYDNDKIKFTYYYVYDKDGRLIENNDYTAKKYTYEYENDKDGNLVQIRRELVPDEDNETLGRKTYDKSGKLIRDQLYTKNMYTESQSKVPSSSKYIKDKKRGEFELLSDYTHIYDKNGKMKEIKQNIYSSGDIKISYDFKEDGVYGKIGDAPGQRWMTYYDKDGREIEYMWLTQPSSQVEPMVQLHLLYQDTKYDKNKNLTQQIATRIEVVNENTGEYKDFGTYSKKIIEYEYYKD